MSFVEKLQNIDRRWIYILAWIFVLYPLINPLGLPVPIQKESTAWNKAINDIPDGSVVVFSCMFSIASIPELYPMTIATFSHLMTKNCKIIVATFWNDGALVFDQTLLKQIDPATYGKVYGKDWIDLGYAPGAETAMRAFADDMVNTFPSDYLYSKPTSSYEIMQNIKTAADVDIIVSFESGTPGVGEWLRQWNTPYGTKLIVGCSGVSAPGMAPYLQSGQLNANLPGLTSTAEYELLIKRPALATAGVDAVSMSHLLVVLLVILGNVGYFATRRRKS